MTQIVTEARRNIIRRLQQEDAKKQRSHYTKRCIYKTRHRAYSAWPSARSCSCGSCWHGC